MSLAEDASKNLPFGVHLLIYTGVGRYSNLPTNFSGMPSLWATAAQAMGDVDAYIRGDRTEMLAKADAVLAKYN